jgi:hypothetical protein
VSGAVALAITAMLFPARLGAQPASPSVSLDDDDLGGVVSGPNGPEAGVWVIAETTDLPTKYAKSVVTDERGRYVLPDLPRATYSIWVRGYGLVDSPKVRSAPGRALDLTATPAPDAKAAAAYYPAIYWYSMLKIPDAAQFAGGGDIPEKLTQVDWLKQMKNIGCIGCHQLGQGSTRTIPKNSASSRRTRRPGSAASSRASRASRWSTSWPAFSGERRSSTTPIGPSASPRASCRRRARNGRRVSSATSW